MNRLITKKGQAAVATVALILLSSLPNTSAAPLAAGSPVIFTYKVVNPGFVGLVAGQTMSLNFVLADGSVRAVRAEVKVIHNGATILVRNHALNSTAILHTLDIRRSDLPVTGEPVTNRVQLWVEVTLVLSAPSQKQAQNPAAALYTPTFQLINEESGETVLVGLLLPAVNGGRESARR
ncbi:MAG TPA: hypothetical protein VJT74_15890 [Pyrinomonadaceae bacterium]|nr:hypothetical protein [Pyrinomonadaceae bacterium]